MSDPLTIEGLRAVLEPFVKALNTFEAQCLFGGLSSKGAGVYYPDNTKFSLVHVREDDTCSFCGTDDDIGTFTLGDLRKLLQATALEGYALVPPPLLEAAAAYREADEAHCGASIEDWQPALETARTAAVNALLRAAELHAPVKEQDHG